MCKFLSAAFVVLRTHQKLKLQLKMRNFEQKKPLDCQLFMKETIEKSPRHLFPSQFLGNRNCNVSEHENLLHHFSVYIIIWHDKELLIRAKKNSRSILCFKSQKYVNISVSLALTCIKIYRLDIHKSFLIFLSLSLSFSVAKNISIKYSLIY